MVGVLHVLFIAHIYAEFSGNRVGNKRFILPKAVHILDIHFGFLKNEVENDLFLPFKFKHHLPLQPHKMANDRLGNLGGLFWLLGWPEKQ